MFLKRSSIKMLLSLMQEELEISFLVFKLILQKIENALASQVALLIKSSLYNIIVIFMFFKISWKMTLFTLAIMLPTMFFGPVYGRAMRKLQKEISDGKAAASALAEEAFSNVRTVKAFATEDRECTAYAEKNDFVFTKSREAALCYGFFQFIMQFVM